MELTAGRLFQGAVRKHVASALLPHHTRIGDGTLPVLLRDDLLEDSPESGEFLWSKRPRASVLSRYAGPWLHSGKAPSHRSRVRELLRNGDEYLQNNAIGVLT